MSAQVPLWIQVLSALLTPTIAIGVGIIAFLQWRTAHQRIVLDLFNQRLKVYEDIADVVGKVMAYGSVDRAYSTDDQSGLDAHYHFVQAAQHVPFFFGQDVEDYIEKLRLQLIHMKLAESMIEAEDGKPTEWIRKKYYHIKQIAKFYKEFPALCEPYMRLDQKRVRTPFRWIVDSIGLKRRAPQFGNPDIEEQ